MMHTEDKLLFAIDLCRTTALNLILDVITENANSHSDKTVFGFLLSHHRCTELCTP